MNTRWMTRNIWNVAICMSKELSILRPSQQDFSEGAHKTNYTIEVHFIYFRAHIDAALSRPLISASECKTLASIECFSEVLGGVLDENGNDDKFLSLLSSLNQWTRNKKKLSSSVRLIKADNKRAQHEIKILLHKAVNLFVRIMQWISMVRKLSVWPEQWAWSGLYYLLGIMLFRCWEANGNSVSACFKLVVNSWIFINNFRRNLKKQYFKCSLSSCGFFKLRNFNHCRTRPKYLYLIWFLLWFFLRV